MKNLLAGTQIATLFLDNDLKVRRFTPPMQDIMALRDADTGRPVGEVHVKLEYNEMEKDAQKVLDDLNSLERELKGPNGRWRQMRIMPYRTAENVIDGVVITFTDITRLKKSEQESEAARRFAESVVDTVNEPLLILDGDLNVEDANKAFLERFQVTRKKTMNTKLYDLGNRQWDIPELRKLLEEVLPKKREIEEYKVEHDFPNIGKKRMFLNARAIPMTDDEKQRILLAVIRIEDV
jgi:two-component system CheB/CheR fusion protein